MLSVAPQFDIRPIDLGNGWAGRILVGSDRPLPLSLPVLSDARATWRQWLRTLVEDPQALPDYAVLKYSKTSQVCQATLPDPGLACTVIAKQSRPDSFRQHLRRWLGPSRAQRGFEQALRLLACSIPTAAPLAVVDRRGRRAESWLVTQAIPDPVDLDNIALALLPRTPPHAWRRIKNVLIQRIVELFVRLEEHRLAHRDLKASNLLFTDWDSQGDEPRLWVVDLDGLSAGKPGRRWQPHVRLAASLAEYPTITRTDCARLLKQHLARTTVAGPTLWKSVWPTLAPRVADYVRAARARKIHKLDGEG